jgi:hypothetical protein
MMARPYEDPRKTELCQQLLEAVDLAGYSVEEDSPPLELPSASGLKGTLGGDLQAVAGDGKRHVYFVRTEPSKAIPQWIANYAEAARSMDDVEVYVAAEQTSELLEESCRACGAGLLRLSQERELELLVSPGEYDEQREREDFLRRAKDLRRRLDTKEKLLSEEVEQNFAGTRRLTQGMPQDVREGYVTAIETLSSQLREWYQDTYARLDTAAATFEDEELLSIEKLIEEGPQYEDLPEVGEG